MPGTAVRGSSTVAAPRAAVALANPDHMVDPEVHAAFLSNLHQATIVTEETGRLLQMVVGEELEPAIKDLSSALMHSKGSRGELDGILGRFETALSRMRTARAALAGYVDRIEEMGQHFPGR